MIAGVGRVMTSAAGAGDGGEIQKVVESGDTRDVERLLIEKQLAARNTRAPAVPRAFFGRNFGVKASVWQSGPDVIEADSIFSLDRVRVAGPGIIDSHKERGYCLSGKGGRPTLRP